MAVDQTLGFEHDELHYSDQWRRRQRLILPRQLEARRAIPETDLPPFYEAHAIVTRWADLETSGRLQAMREQNLKPSLLAEFFGQALRYAPFSDGAAEWNLQPEAPVNGGTADALLGVFTGTGERSPRVVVEIKGPDAPLDRPAGGGRTPVQQLWDYLNALPECPWGILTNCVSFRLYHRSRPTRAYEHFTLQALRDLNRFREFYVLFERDGLLPSRGRPEPRADALLRATAERQREVGDELYQKYSDERLELIRHLSTARGRSLDDAIRIAQRIIDRIVFIAFCEDRDLITARTLARAYDDLPRFVKKTNPRWENFVNLFHAIDAGHVDLGIDRGYNGNLFKPDPDIDGLDLDDHWTAFFKHIGEYDFRDEVNVDVLGHLFEQSITELERIRIGGLPAREEPTGGAPGTMRKSAQRKRSGVFYTPPEFTAWLVRATVGELLDQRFADLRARRGLGDGPPMDADASRAHLRDCLAALREFKVVDPACGSGAFLIAAYDYLEERYHRLIADLDALKDADARALRDQVPDLILCGNLFGVDLSPEAVEITQLALWIRSARKGRTLADLSGNIVCGNSLVDDPAIDPAAFDWRQRFAGIFERDAAGFDAVIGNPPWERLKLQEREFFSLSSPHIAAAVSAADRRKQIERLKSADPELHERYLAASARADAVLGYARSSGRYPLTGKGDINTYMLFAELARSIVSPRGRAGLLVPSGIATDATTREFFQSLMSSKALVSLHDYENRKLHFPDVDSRFKFCTLVFNGTALKTESADFVFFLRDVKQLEERKRHIPLTEADLALFNPNTRTCPIFRSRKDAELTRRVYRNVPILIDRNRKRGGNPWQIRFLRMLDQTNDAELFKTAEELRALGLKLDGNRWKKGKQVYLPLYEAKMVQAYDHRAASVVIERGNWMRQGQTVETSLVQHQNPEYVVQPRWWVDRAAVVERLGETRAPAHLAYKDITSPTNQRTMIAAFLPECAVVNTAPLVLLTDGLSIRKQCCLLANLNALALDFVARQKVGGLHLNFFIVEQLPVLPPGAYDAKCPWHSRQRLESWISERVLKLTCTAEDMIPLAEAAGFEEKVHPWRAEERAQLMAELDAAFLHLYRLERGDVEHLLSTFQGFQDEAGPVLPGFPSAELILEQFDRLAT